MARPRRPVAEARAVIQAAKLVRSETGITNAEGLSREVAVRVTRTLADDMNGPGDALDAALKELEHRLYPSPIWELACCAEIDTAHDFIERQIGRLRARSGRYLTEGEQQQERREIEVEMHRLLTRRYLRHLRS